MKRQKIYAEEILNVRMTIQVVTKLILPEGKNKAQSASRN